MKFLLPMMLLLFSLALPVSALEVLPPEVPSTAAEIMPENTEHFLDAMMELLHHCLLKIRPELAEGLHICFAITAAIMLFTLIDTIAAGVRKTARLTGTVVIAALLITNADSMIGLAGDTIQQLSDYGKLLLPVMTAALAAQGGVTTSAALYTGTAVFDALLGNLLTTLFVPLVYLFLVLAAAHSALGEDLLKRFRDFIKNTVSWCLKILLTIFTTYMSITGVVSGTTDAAALKAARVTISSVVPVVGGILSDASEAVLVSAGLMKNAAGIYGIIAVCALFLYPFLRIGLQYLLLKATAAICSIFGTKEITGLIEDFATAMGLLLGMTAASCLLLLISAICFMKGVG